jgi:hypothetical protein
MSRGFFLRRGALLVVVLSPILRRLKIGKARPDT